MPHDFFEPQPIAGADVYIMRHICHNWSNDNSAKIIGGTVPVLKAGSKILLVEAVVLPSNTEESSVAERYMRYVVAAWQLVIEHVYDTDPNVLIANASSQKCGCNHASDAEYPGAK